MNKGLTGGKFDKVDSRGTTLLETIDYLYFDTSRSDRKPEDSSKVSLWFRRSKIVRLVRESQIVEEKKGVDPLALNLNVKEIREDLLIFKDLVLVSVTRQVKEIREPLLQR